MGNIHENLHEFSSWYRNSLEAACQKFRKMLKVILSYFFLSSQEPQVIKKKKKKLPFLPLESSAPDLAIFLQTNFLSISFSPIFSQSSSREQTHNTISPSSGPEQAVQRQPAPNTAGTTGKRRAKR